MSSCDQHLLQSMYYLNYRPQVWQFQSATILSIMIGETSVISSNKCSFFFVWVTSYFNSRIQIHVGYIALRVLEFLKSMTKHHHPKHPVILNTGCASIYIHLVAAVEILWLHGIWLMGLPEQQIKISQWQCKYCNF